MKNIVAGGVLALFAAVQVYGFQWPSDPEYITHSFCELQEGSVSLGIQFDHPESVKPFDEGDVVYRYWPDPFSPLPGGGNTSVLVLEHENGFQSVYEGLDAEVIRRIPGKVTGTGFIRAAPGENGYHFSIRDARLQRLVNPLLLLPGLNDRRAPEMVAMQLVSEEGVRYDVSQDMEIPAGNYRVYILVTDGIGRNIPLVLSPFSVSLYNLGSLQAEKKLDTIVQSGRHLSLQDGTPVEEIYDTEGFLSLGEMVLNSGTASLEVGMEDFFGNTRTDIVSFTVAR